VGVIPPSASASSYHGCGPGNGGGGGAFNMRVKGISCRSATQITEGGLTPNGSATRQGGFRCQHFKGSGKLHYTRTRVRGRQGMKFETF
jgi:hypothetical protein